LGNVSSDLKDYGAAKKYYEQALSIQREIGNRPGQGRCLNNLGEIYRIQGDYAVAKSYCKQSLAIFSESNNRNGVRISLDNLGVMAWKEGDYTTALAYYKQAAAICTEINLKLETAYYFGILGMILCNQEAYNNSQEYFERSLSICRNSGRRIEGFGLHGSATTALFQGDLLLAETLYQQAITIYEGLEQSYYLFESWAGLAKVKAAQGDWESARRHGQQILAYLKGNSVLNAVGRGENPLCAFRFTWETLVALEQTAEADQVLALAAQIMQSHLDKNDDPALQEIYLDQPHHKVLWAAWMGKQVS